MFGARRTNKHNIRRILKDSMKGVPTGFAINRTLREYHKVKDNKNTQFMANPSMSVAQQQGVTGIRAPSMLKRNDSSELNPRATPPTPVRCKLRPSLC